MNNNIVLTTSPEDFVFLFKLDENSKIKFTKTSKCLYYNNFCHASKKEESLIKSYIKRKFTPHSYEEAKNLVSNSDMNEREKEVSLHYINSLLASSIQRENQEKVEKFVNSINDVSQLKDISKEELFLIMLSLLNSYKDSHYYEY